MLFHSHSLSPFCFVCVYFNSRTPSNNQTIIRCTYAFAKPKHTENEFTKLANNYTLGSSSSFFLLFLRTNWRRVRESQKQVSALFLWNLTVSLWGLSLIFFSSLLPNLCARVFLSYSIRSVAPCSRDYMFHFHFILIQINVACSFWMNGKMPNAVTVRCEWCVAFGNPCHRFALFQLGTLYMWSHEWCLQSVNFQQLWQA